jgi:hypothetical protein
LTRFAAIRRFQRAVGELGVSQKKTTMTEPLESDTQEQQPNVSLEVKCPKCGTDWELNSQEANHHEFICGECKTIIALKPQIPRSIGLQEIITAFIRLLAIKFGLDTFNFILVAIGQNLRIRNTLISDLAGCAFLIVITYWLWRLAPFLARRVTSMQNPTIEACHLNLLEIYSFAFLFLGLYFAVDALPPSLTWFHFTITQNAPGANLAAQQQGHFYTLFKYVAKCILGLSLIFNGRKFAIKLILFQTKNG